MPYATATDMLLRFTEREMMRLTDIEEPVTNAVVAAVLERALGDASAEIDGYITSRYQLPLADPPELLRVMCCDIARYRLQATSADDQAKEAYKAAIAYLTKVAEGRINLVPPQDVPPPTGAGAVLFAPGTKAMGRDSYFGGDA